MLRAPTGEARGPQLESRPCARQRRPSTTAACLFKVSICQRPGGASRGHPRQGLGALSGHMVRTKVQRSDPRTDRARSGGLAGLCSQLGQGPPWALSRAPALATPGASSHVSDNSGPWEPCRSMRGPRAAGTLTDCQPAGTWGTLFSVRVWAPLSCQPRGPPKEGGHQEWGPGPGVQVPRSPKSQVLGPGLGSSGPGAFLEGEQWVGRAALWAVGRPGAICGAHRVLPRGAVLSLPMALHPGWHPESGGTLGPIATPHPALEAYGRPLLLPRSQWPQVPACTGWGPSSCSLCAGMTLGAPSVGTGLGAAEHKGRGGAGSGPPPLPVCPHVCCCPSGRREGLHAWGRAGHRRPAGPCVRTPGPATAGLPGVVQALGAAGPGCPGMLRP